MRIERTDFICSILAFVFSRFLDFLLRPAFASKFAELVARYAQPIRAVQQQRIQRLEFCTEQLSTDPQPFGGILNFGNPLCQVGA